MRMPTARMRMVNTTKKMMVWTRTAFPLVLKLPNSTCLVLPGSWNISPGERSMNSRNPTNMGAQSAIAESALWSVWENGKQRMLDAIERETKAKSSLFEYHTGVFIYAMCITKVGPETNVFFSETLIIASFSCKKCIGSWKERLQFVVGICCMFWNSHSRWSLHFRWARELYAHATNLLYSV